MEFTKQKETVMKAKFMLQMIVVALALALAASFASVANARTTPISKPARHTNSMASSVHVGSSHSSSVSAQRVRAHA